MSADVSGAGVVACDGVGDRLLHADDVGQHTVSGEVGDDEQRGSAEEARGQEGAVVGADAPRRYRELVGDAKTVVVLLDSDHTRDHVRAELEAYGGLVTKGSYLIIFDTVVEYMNDDAFPDRPWGVGDNPYTAVQEFLKTTDRFVLNKEIENKLLLTVGPGGWLKCVKD